MIVILIHLDSVDSLEYVLYLFKMTTFEKTISLINHQEADLLERIQQGGRSAQHFPQTTRRSNDDVGLFQLSLLLVQ